MRFVGKYYLIYLAISGKLYYSLHYISNTLNINFDIKRTHYCQVIDVRSVAGFDSFIVA